MMISADRPGLGPTPELERIPAVDIVRAFALWGVLLINMMNFGALAPGQWPEPVDQFAFWAQRFFFEQKSWRLFSFLFGFGFALQLLRARDRGSRFLAVYSRRLALLFAFGFFHYLIYPGDILVPYAILGFGLLLFQHWPPRWILLLVALLFLIHPVTDSIWPEDQTAPPAHSVNPLARISLRAPDPQYRQKLQTAPAIWGGVRVRVQRVLDIARARAQQFPSWRLNPRDHWRGTESWTLYFAMFLLGLYAGKRRVFHDFHTHRVLINRTFYYGLPLGLLAMTSDWIFRDFVPGPLPAGARFLREIIWAYGATALALSYAAGLVLLLQRPQWRHRLRPLEAMGRTALTVYLTQSIIFNTLFLDYGFDLQRRVGPAAVFGYAAVIYAGQLAICVWWVKRFRFGPFEWLWRTLTYARWQPMRPLRSKTARVEGKAQEGLV